MSTNARLSINYEGIDGPVTIPVLWEGLNITLAESPLNSEFTDALLLNIGETGDVPEIDIVADKCGKTSRVWFDYDAEVFEPHKFLVTESDD